MTLSSTLTKVQYNGDDSTTVFAVSFVFYTDADLRAILTVTATGVETVQALTTNYTLTGGNGATGTLTMLTAPPTGTTLTIKSNISDTQESALPLGGDFPSITVERRLDIITRLVQQQAEEIARLIGFSETTTTTGIEVPDPVSLNILSWNSAANQMVNIAITDISTAIDTVFTSLASGDFLKFDGTNWVNETAATARTSLAVPGTGTVNTFSKTQTLTKGADLTPAAAAITLGTDGNYFDVAAGNFATINGISGTFFTLQMDGVSVLTHNGSTLDLPGEANFTSAAGDIIQGFMTGVATAQILGITQAAASGVAASQADQETGTEVGKYVAPATQEFHQSAAKGWVRFDGTGTLSINKSYNVSSVTDNGTGNYTINWATDFSDGDYCAVGSIGGVAGTSINIGSYAAGSVIIVITVADVQTAVDTGATMVAAFGDQ